MPNQAQAVKPVVKPILTGHWYGRDAARKGGKLMLNLLFVTFLYLALSLLLSFDSLILRIAAGLMLVFTAAAFLYYQGMNAGQTDAAFSEIMYQRQAEGKPIAPEELDRCFHPAKGFYASLLGALPYLLVALVFAVMCFFTQVPGYKLGVLPAWLGTSLREGDTGTALHYYSLGKGMDLLTVLRIIVRCLTMPVLNIAVKIGDAAALWADRLSPLWVAIAPLGYGLGYRQGQAIRTKINTSIMIGNQRKKKRERKERRARQNGGSPQRLI